MDPLFKEVGIYAGARPALRAGRLGPRAVLSRGDRRPGARGGHHRGRLDGQLPGGRHVLRDARRADDPVLHLLFDVRVPAHRRPDLGVRRRARPRLPAGRHGRPDDAQRRGAAARGRPLATSSPRRSRTSGRTTRRSPTRSRRSSATASSGCTSKGEDVFYYLTLYNENYVQPARPEGVDARRDPPRASTASPRRRTSAEGVHRPRVWSAPARSSSRCSPRATCSPRSSASRPRSAARRRSSCCAATRSRPSAGTASIPMPASRACRTSARSCRTTAGRSSRRATG